MVDEETQRERFKKIMDFKKPDRLLWMEDQLDTTTLRWIREGLPIERVAQTHYDVGFGGSLYIFWPSSYTFDVSSYFGFLPPPPLSGATITLDFCPLPRHTLRVVKETSDKVFCVTPFGGRMEYSKIDYTMPNFVEFPVKNRKDWEEVKKRLNPTDPRRYPKDYNSEEYIRLFEEATSPTSMVLNGFYAFGRGMMGTAGFTPAFYTDPELVHEMMNTYTDFMIDVMKEMVETLKARIDWIFWWEDLAHGIGPNISPKVFKEFILPNLKKVTSFLNKNDIDMVIMDSDGDFRILMPLLWEGGIKGIWPLEVKAGMDAVELRKEWGRTWRLIGNIEKDELLKGEEAIKREVDQKVPILKELGGYIPGLDHSIPPNVSLKDFTFYANYVKSLLDY